jgi:hypothetical protein
VLSSANPVAASRALLAGVANLHPGESVVLRWALRPGAARPLRETSTPDEKARKVRRAWEHKTAVPGLSVGGLRDVPTGAAHLASIFRAR